MHCKLTVTCFAALLALAPPTSSQEPPVRLTLVGTIGLETIGSTTISAFRNLMFVGQGNASGGGVAIVDISDPAAPRKVGETPHHPNTFTAETRAVRIGRRVILAVGFTGSGPSTASSPRGLKLFDVTDPARPIEVGFYDTGAGGLNAPGLNGAAFLDIAVTPIGRVLVLLSTQGTEVVSSDFGARPGIGDLQIVDITDPSSPALAGEWGVLDEPTMGRDFLLRQQRGARADAFTERVFASRDGQRAYLAYSDHGVMILDLSDPSRPRLIRHIGFFDANDEGAAFDVRPARGGRTLIRSHLVRFDFHVRLWSNVYFRSRNAGEAFTTPAIFNLPQHSMTGEVVFVGRGCPGDPYLSDPNGRIAVITGEGCILNLKAARAQLMGAAGVIFFGDAPSAPFDAQFPPPAGGIVAMPDGTNVTLSLPVIGVGQNTGRCLAQVQDPSGTLIARDCFPASPVRVLGTAVFQGSGGLDIFDIRNLEDPVKLASFGTPNSVDIDVALANRFPNPRRFFSANYLEAAGGLVFASWENDGLRVIDISRPRFPREVAAWHGEGRPAGAPPLRAWQIVRHRDLILMKSLGDGVYILRVDPAAGLAETENDR